MDELTSICRLSNVKLFYPRKAPGNFNAKKGLFSLLRRGSIERPSQSDRVVALEGIELEIKRGMRLGIVGRNGAGKSTLLRVISGSLSPQQGEVIHSGSVLGLTGFGSVGLNRELTGYENIQDLAVCYGASQRWLKANLKQMCDFSGLGLRIHDPVFTYSDGMVTRVRVASVVFLSSELVVMDEHIGYADAEFNKRLAAHFRTFLDRSSALVLASHSDAILREYCADGVVLEHGRIVFHGDIEGALSFYHQLD